MAGRSATANHQTTAHSSGGSPCRTNTQRQDMWSSMNPDSGDMRIAEIGRHVIHSAFARARSACGNHDASRISTAGQTPPSNSPSSSRARCSWVSFRTSPQSTAANAQAIIRISTVLRALHFAASTAAGICSTR